MLLTFVTPEKKILVSQEVDELTVPGFAGELNILPGHAPLMTLLETGVVKWKVKGSNTNTIAVVSEGYCEIKGEEVTVLAEQAELPSEINVTQAKADLSEAERKMTLDGLSEEERAKVLKDAAMARAKIALN